MILKEKEKTVIQDLQTQEKSCVEKYGRYADQAKDPELKSLFQKIQQDEQKHYDALTQVLDGQVPQCDCNDSDGRNYEQLLADIQIEEQNHAEMLYKYKTVNGMA